MVDGDTKYLSTVLAEIFSYENKKPIAGKPEANCDSFLERRHSESSRENKAHEYSENVSLRLQKLTPVSAGKPSCTGHQRKGYMSRNPYQRSKTLERQKSIGV
jgi:hypothetical protein